MPEITLDAQIGRTPGSSFSRRLRAAGMIPGVVYGPGTEPVSVAVAGRDLRIALNGEAGTNALLSLKAGETTCLTVARELQRHPVKGTVTHVDFQVVRRDQIITADVPLTLIGEATAVHNGDGLVDQQLFALPIRATPGNIPTGIEIDISALQMGAVIRVADVPLPDGVEADLDGEMAIVTGVPPRVGPGGAPLTVSEGGEAPDAPVGSTDGDAAEAAEQSDSEG